MTRRRLVALVSAAVLVTLGLVVFAAGLFVTGTDTGREWVRGFAQPLLSRAVHGTWYLGRIRGISPTAASVDSMEIKDARGEVLFASGPITISFNPRDFIDNRIYIRKAQIEHPFVHIIQHEDGKWNFQEVFAQKPSAPSKPKELNTRNFGDFIVLDSVSTRGATFLLTLPWHPDDSLRGAKRDSVIRVHLTTPEKAVARTYDGFGRTYAWRDIQALISHARLADPDSDNFGRTFKVATLSVDEYEPTFKFRNLRGDVRILGDSVWFQVPHFDMPASTGHGTGKVWWGSDLPVRYDIAVRGDSVSLDDVNWVYPTLPRTGGGTLDLLIQNDPKDLHVVDFTLKKMDVASTRSHITGDMSFGIGAPVLLVRDVDLRADPMNFDLIRTLNGKPFPEDWQGNIIGTVKGRGGPLTNFFVDQAQARFEDAHVRGAVSSFTARGGLDILDPAFTKFHGLDVNAKQLDLRTIEYLFPDFPKLGGTIAGTATLDSSWLDVRFSNANIVHQDGPGEPSHITGSGRITWGAQLMTYDVALDAAPLSLTMLARSPEYVKLPFRGTVSGPIRATGQTPDLALTMSLQGAAGALSFDGRVDADSAGGYGAHGHGDFSAIDPARLLEDPALRTASLNGHYAVDVAGPSLSDIMGSADVALERSVFDSVPVYPSHASVRFADGQMRIADSLRIHTYAATLDAHGGLGLPGGRPDSLFFHVDVDSLGGLRRYLSHPDTTILGAAGTPADSLSGSIHGTAVLAGTMDSLNARGELDGSRVYVTKDRGDSVTARFDLADVLRAPRGTVSVGIDTVTLAGIALDTIGGVLRLDGQSNGTFTLGARAVRGPLALASGGRWNAAGASRIVQLDSLGLDVGADRWRLAGPAHLVLDSLGMRLDSLVARNLDSASITVAGDVPDSGMVAGRIAAAHVPLRDLGTIVQDSSTLSGLLDANAVVSGTKLQPRIVADALARAVNWSGVDIDHVSSSLHYANDSLVTNMEVVRKNATALHADAALPLELTLFGARKVPGEISGSFKADSTDLSIIQAPLHKLVRDVSGYATADVQMSGTWKSLAFSGAVEAQNASGTVLPMGVSLRNVNAAIGGAVNPSSGEDSINVRATAESMGKPNGRLALNGWVTNPQRTFEPTFNLALGAESFRALNQRSLADLYFTTPTSRDSLRLRGSILSPTLSGNLRVDHSAIYLADRDLARKQDVELISEPTAGPSDVTGLALVSKLLTNLSPNVTITLGEDVRLKSAEANVIMASGGQVVLNKSTELSTRRLAKTGELIPNLQLEGALYTRGGTYNLNLGVVQREFNVQQGGTLTFDGPTEFPVVDLKAQYPVRQARDRDLNVIVELAGRMPNPAITFTSDAGYELSTSDILSYLLIGKPGLDFTSNNQATEVLASVLTPTLSAVATDRLRQTLGSAVDVFSLQLGATQPTQAANPFSVDNLRYSLASATLNAETAVGHNLYLSLNTGLCALSSQSSQGRANPLSGVGAKAEYRFPFNPSFAMQVAIDPPTSSRVCGTQQVQLLNGLQPTPTQFSISFSQTWHP
ncbi:MAG TPA: hypothetical protein VHB25_12465 [Gemmatimonadaceae bacterium]|nr:hypothetical protein [Gemmatimonadaceae bacterium]